MRLITTIIFTCLLALSQASIAEVAGLIIVAQGDVTATNEAGESRQLKRRSKIFEGDTIKTGAKGKAQIRFIDKALLSLKPNSELSIAAYQQAKADSGNDEQVLMNLVAGGFRTITGSIGKGKKEAYKVNTPAASIGIRGTNYEIAQSTNSASEFVMAAWSGSINVQNDSGSIQLGMGGSHQFLRVEKGSAPVGLMQMPNELRQQATPRQASPSDEQESETEKKSEENQELETADSEEEAENTASLEESTANNSNDNESDSDEPQSDAAIVNTDASNSSEATDETTATDIAQEDVAEEAENNLQGFDEEGSNDPLIRPDSITPFDSRFNEFLYADLVYEPYEALIIPTDDSSMVRALSVEGDDQRLILVLPTDNFDPNSTFNNNFETVTLDLNDQAVEQLNLNVGDVDSVIWGYWNSSTTPIERIQNTAAGTQSIEETVPAYFLRVIPENASRLRGQFDFSSTGLHIGDINGNSINELTGSFVVDFTTGSITDGSLNFSDGNQQWAMSYEGQVSGASATMSNINGNITGVCEACILGSLTGTFAQGQAYVGGFNLENNTQTSTARGLYFMRGVRR